MEKYNQFITETTTTSVFEKDEHKARLDHLVKIVAPLIEEIGVLYSQVSKYKRCTRLTNEFREAWGKIFTESIKKELPPSKEIKGGKLIKGAWYTYQPDGDTRPNFIHVHRGRAVQFVRYTNSINAQFADSISKPTSCNVLVSYLEPYRGTMQFWTREQCLKEVKRR